MVKGPCHYRRLHYGKFRKHTEHLEGYPPTVDVRGRYLNHGSTCWLNSLLQALSSCEVMRSPLCHLPSCAIGLVQHSISNSSDKDALVGTHAFFSWLTSVGVSPFQQQDPSEVFQLMLQHAEPCCFTLFGEHIGTLRMECNVELFVCGCRESDTRNNEESGTIEFLDLGGCMLPTSLQDLLVSVSVVCPSTQQPTHCATCMAKTRITQTSEIQAQGSCVFIALKRMLSTLEKNTRCVYVNPTLTIGGREAELATVVEHKGQNVDNGHYVCWTVHNERSAPKLIQQCLKQHMSCSQ